MRMMDIDNEHLGIPEQDYSAVVTMPSVDFQVCFALDKFLVILRFQRKRFLHNYF